MFAMWDEILYKVRNLVGFGEWGLVEKEIMEILVILWLV